MAAFKEEAIRQISSHPDIKESYKGVSCGDPLLHASCARKGAHCDSPCAHSRTERFTSYFEVLYADCKNGRFDALKTVLKWWRDLEEEIIAHVRPGIDSVG